MLTTLLLTLESDSEEARQAALHELLDAVDEIRAAHSTVAVTAEISS